jgi:hypothetical protein
MVPLELGNSQAYRVDGETLTVQGKLNDVLSLPSPS